MPPCPAATRARRSRNSTGSTRRWSRPISSAPASCSSASSNLLRNPADDHSLLVFDPTIRGKTDRFVYQVPEAALSDEAEAAAQARAAGGAPIGCCSSLVLGLAVGGDGGQARRRHPRAGAAGVGHGRRAVAQCAQDDGHPADRRAAGGRYRQGRRGGAGRPHRRPLGAVDRHRLHRLGDFRRR